jgi:hypothetical protein
MNYTYLKNHEEFLEFIKRLWTEASIVGTSRVFSFSDKYCIDSFLDFVLGNTDKLYDLDGEEDFGDVLDYQPFTCEPKQYPSIAVWYFEDSWDRVGDSSIKVLEFIDVKGLKKEKECLCFSDKPWWEEEE